MLRKTVLLSCLAFANAQTSGIVNFLTNPGCSTVASIVNSCGPKLQLSATISSAVFSCICYDGLGNYTPEHYDDAASSCTAYQLSVLHTTGNSFLQYVAGFCTDPSYAPATSGVATTTAGSPGSTETTSTQVGGLSSTTAANPAPVKTPSSSSQTALITAPPNTQTGSGTRAGAPGAAVTSTSSKADGTTIRGLGSERLFLLIFGSFVGSLLVL